MIFENFARPLNAPTPLRQAITGLYRKPEPECVAQLLAQCGDTAIVRDSIAETATRLVLALREKNHTGAVDGLVKEYALSSQEGVALMCLAEALLRIPDNATRDALIRDKIAGGDWRSHVGTDRPMFVNAASWGLVITGKLYAPVDDNGLAQALTRLIGRIGEPVIRRGVDLAMRLLGEQFVVGETIKQALGRAQTLEDRGFSYSYDMLGEAAATAKDAEDYLQSYTAAIHAIGISANKRGIYDGPGISIKLSALHPRYSRAQNDRVIAELLPRVRELAVIARSYDIGFNIDAEEADRLELSLDILESLALDKGLSGWNGLGFVIQAYGKRCPAVIDWLVDLARRADRRIMVRLVKGAYWDAEIKRAQVDGLIDFPVYTRKVHTDVAYLACAQKLLDARDCLFPQFATHNAQSLAAIYHMAGYDFNTGDYEFQCLHGMGQPLYEEVVGPDKLNRPCRIYAPVGTHETLLAYLVRRLLENGANSSFVNRIADPAVPIELLIADPIKQVRAAQPIGASHDSLRLPAALFTDRRNSSGIDISDETILANLSAKFAEIAAQPAVVAAESIPIRNPGDHRDIVGHVQTLSLENITKAVDHAAKSDWALTPVNERALCLERAADALEHDRDAMLCLIMREAGKTMPNAIAEIREAVDFLRYYAVQARTTLIAATPLGPVACISPWNFPLAIFTGQIAAALVAGNAVLAKPAEETPLVAAAAVRILHAAGIPVDALHLITGDGEAGAALVADPRVAGVIFTGSTQVAKLIQHTLSQRLSLDGNPIPFIAETGGQNAMIVDSSALPEQVVADVIASAFDSAGQRCSALRILCLQNDIAERTITMLKGAMAELRTGPTDIIGTDIGPVISAQARDSIETYVATMAAAGHAIHRTMQNEHWANGTYVAPTLIEIDNIDQLGAEVFGPVLHIVRFHRDRMDAILQAISATGYGLTFGLHTRLDSTTNHVLNSIHCGNRYVNRNTIGAVVGVQPFGGSGLSGTGPKAGGPLYLTRLATGAAQPLAHNGLSFDSGLLVFIDWLGRQGHDAARAIACAYGNASPLGLDIELPGPVGERNSYTLKPRGVIMLHASTDAGLYQQIAAVLATGNYAYLYKTTLPDGLPIEVLSRIKTTVPPAIAGALIEADTDSVLALQTEIASMYGQIVTLQNANVAACASRMAYRADWLCEEMSTSVNTTAAGGNASLMSLEL